MTKEQATEVLHELDGSLYETQQVALDMAIKALEQQPCDDCVSRAEVLKFVEYFNNPTFIEPMGTLRNMLKDLPPVTPTQRWIPITNPYEDLPKSNRLWVTRKETTLGKSYYDVDIVGYDMTDWDDDISSVIAYMEFAEPKPYEEKRGNENEVD